MMPYQQRQKTILLDECNIDKLRTNILNYFQQTWNLYENLFSCLKNEKSYYIKANRLRHPLIFYYGHTATFYINKLISMNLIPERINEKFEAMFAIGVDEMSWDDLNEAHYNWPKVQEVQAYRDSVFDLVSNFIETMPLKTPITQDDAAWIILMGIEHGNIHLETSSVLIRELPLEYVQTQKQWQACVETSTAPINKLLAVNAAKINLAKENQTYGWDNEYGAAEFTVNEFKASKYLVSNQEFLKFIETGGYQNKKFWTKEAWNWCQSTKTQKPYFWRIHDKKYFLRILAEEIPMLWDWPVEVNYYEAKAFCNYLSSKLKKPIRLPSEAEWSVFATQLEQKYPHWQQAPANIDLAHYASSCPVTKFQHGDFYDAIGNVWQWTETPIYAFDGFQVHKAYDDFSVPTFDGQHHILKGGSWISCGNEVLLESRYAFRKHFFQYAGIRYVEAMQEHSSENLYYESDTLLGQYLELHYGSNYFQEKNFMENLVQTIMRFLPNATQQLKALDLGCAVGRGCFELTKHFSEVTGVDFSARFIQAADKFIKEKKLSYKIINEGELFETRKINLQDINYKHLNIQFLQGDACNLKPHLTGYDLIIASNLIDRLYDPKKFLIDIKERLNSNGVLAICSPYTWLEEHTEKKNWLGGYVDENGVEIATFAGLKSVLQNDFNLITEPQSIPFVIRETARKFQHSFSELTLWQKK